MNFHKTAAATEAHPHHEPEPPKETPDAAMVRELLDKGRHTMGQSGHMVFTLSDSTVAAFLEKHGAKPTVQ